MTLLLCTIALIVLFALTMFQLALMLGVPLGKFAWGGQYTRLPMRLRVASTISIFLYLIFMAFIATKAGLVDVINDKNLVSIGMWVFTVYFIVGIVMNGISRSKPERNLMTPVAAILALCFLIVSLTSE